MAAGWNEERLSMFFEGIRLCFSRWTALQLAVDNQWGGRNSAHKAQQLVSDIVAFMTQSKELPYIDDLEDLLDENLLSLFNTEIDDGSIEEVAEVIMHLDEECLVGNYERVEKLSLSKSGAQNSVPQDQEDDDDEDEDDPNPTPKPTTEVEDGMSIDSPAGPSVAADNRNQVLSPEEIADGWEVVRRGKRHGRG